MKGLGGIGRTVIQLQKKGKIFYIKQVKQEKAKKEIVLENHRNNIQLHTLKIQKQTL